MITLTHTSFQPILSKSRNYVIIEYSVPSSIPAGVSSDTFNVILPNITGMGYTYCPLLSSVKILSESTSFQFKLAEDIARFDLDDLLLEVTEINRVYYETKLDIYCNTNNTDHSLIMQLINNSVTDILNIKLRLVFEAFQYTRAFV